MTPRTLFRTFAIAEAITWALLLTALILRATGVTDAAVSIAGGIHGFIVLAYWLASAFTWINQRWHAGIGVLAFALSVVPFATVPFEIVLDRRGKLAGPWRLRPGADTPKGALEHAQAWVLRRPIAAALGALILVACAFVTLLWLGPPVPKA